jgi:hypothetical protein
MNLSVQERMFLQRNHNTSKMRMRTLLITILVLSVVIAVAILPGVDLQPTALRASRAAQGIFVGFALLASMAAGIDVTAPALAFLPPSGKPSFLPHPPLFALTCARLC